MCSSNSSPESGEESCTPSFDTLYAGQDIDLRDFNIEDIDKELRERRLGALVHTKRFGSTFLYLRVPELASMVILQEGTFLPFNSDYGKKLCELNSIRLGYAAKWACKKKDYGRLSARCSSFGSGSSSRSKGIRERNTKRVNCPAFCNTIRAESVLDESDQMSLLTAMADLVDDEEEDSDSQIICTISSFDWHHVAHTSLLRNGVRTSYTRVSDIVQNDDIFRDIRRMLELCGNTHGTGTKVRLQLRKLYPDIMFGENVIRNAIAKIRSDSECAHKFVDTLQAMKQTGQIEYIHLFIHPVTNVLQGAVWSYQGASSVVQRCNDILFWDSTHNTTKFLYRLASFTLIDSEGRNRPVLFSLALQETAETCKQVLSCWHNAFLCQLPHVIFTDGDDSMHAAISSIPYSNDIHHLLCTFHLFDLNVKKKVMPILQATSQGNGSQWELFRKGLSMCREAGSISQFESIWNNLIKEWIPTSRQGNQVRKYLHSYVYATRQQWATCFFPTAFTVGHSTTQRSESWNNLIKLGSKGCDMSQLAEHIQFLCEEQRQFEITQCLSTKANQAFQRVPVVQSTELREIVLGTGISSFAALQLANEFSKAELLRFDVNNPLTVECRMDVSGRNTVLAHGITQYVYPSTSTAANSQESHTKVSLCFKDGDQEEMCAECDCNYLHRMKLPCRHLLALGLSIDRDESKSDLFQTSSRPRQSCLGNRKISCEQALVCLEI